MALVFIATMLVAAGVQAAPSQAAAAQNYLVLYKGNAVAADTIAKAGGSIVARYDKIGVAVVSSSNANFAATVRKDSRVEGAAATSGFATRLEGDVNAADAGPLPGSAPATDSDSLSGLQWDMVQIYTHEAHAITGGSPSVVVGDIDTGLDYTHPDLAANVDDARSANCVSGAPVQGKVAANEGVHQTFAFAICRSMAYRVASSAASSSI